MATMSDAPVLDWFGAACVRSKNGAVQRTRTALPGGSLLQWTAKCLAPFRLQRPPIGLPPFPPGLPAVPAPPPPDTRRTFTPQESHTIDAASSLQPTDPRPPIYGLMLEEGRTLPRIEAILSEAFLPLPDADSPVYIFVSGDLVRDIKEDLKFGYNNDVSFEICHRGISPFMVAAVSQA